MPYTYKQIADEMQVNKITVRRHLEKIESKQGTEYIESQKTQIKDTIFLSDELTERIKESIKNAPIQVQGKRTSNTNNKRKYTNTCTGTVSECTDTRTDTMNHHVPHNEPPCTDTCTGTNQQIIDILKSQIEEHKEHIHYLQEQATIKDTHIQRLTEHVQEITKALEQQQQLNAMCYKQIETANSKTEQQPPEKEEQQEKPKKKFGFFKRK